MVNLQLISTGEYQIQPLVEAALAHEASLMETGIRQTEHRLRMFEKKYGMSTEEFLVRYEQETFQETMDSIEWLGEFRLLERLREKTSILKGIHIAN